MSDIGRTCAPIVFARMRSPPFGTALARHTTSLQPNISSPASPFRMRAINLHDECRWPAGAKRETFGGENSLLEPIIKGRGKPRQLGKQRFV